LLLFVYLIPSTSDKRPTTRTMHLPTSRKCEFSYRHLKVSPTTLAPYHNAQVRLFSLRTCWRVESPEISTDNWNQKLFSPKETISSRSGLMALRKWSRAAERIDVLQVSVS